jgi:transposase-like protein
MKPTEMTILEFEQRFCTEDDCIDYLQQLRWPKGFRCPNCGHDDGYELTTRRLIQCTVCRRQTSVTAGTIFEKTHMSLVIWFRMIYAMAQDKGGASSSRLASQFGIPQKTAWLMLHKIRTAMASRNKSIRLGGDIELDEGFFGKEARKYQPAPGTETQVLVMVESQGDHAGEIVMRIIESASRDNIRDIVDQNIVEDQQHHFKADGWSAHWVLRSMGHDADIQPLPGVLSVEKLPWLHTFMSLTRRFLWGTYHGVSPKMLQLYLDELCFRVNRRFRQSTICNSLLRACVFTLPTTLAELRL